MDLYDEPLVSGSTNLDFAEPETVENPGNDNQRRAKNFAPGAS